MSFELISPQKIWNKSGYIVQGGDRYHLEYIEHDRILIIPVEDRAENKYEIYWERVSGWEPPFENEVITDSDLNRIKANVVSALEFEHI